MSIPETNTNMPFDKWVEYVIASSIEAFNPETIVTPSPMWWSEGKHPEIAITHLTRLFEDIDKITSLLSNEECARLLNYIIDLSSSGYTFVIMNLDNGLLIEDRIRCIKSIYFVFDKLFLKRCPTHPFLRSLSDKDPLATVCFMWWDVIGIYGHPEDERYTLIDKAILEVIESTLRLESDACRESALHGLNEWWIFYPGAVNEIIHRFLNENPHIHPQLLDYALKAKRGELP